MPSPSIFSISYPNIYHSHSNQIYTCIALLAAIFIWIIFKIIYPYPFITIDSYYYIAAAYQNASAGSWPIGYSKFIQLVGLISQAPTLLVTIQFIILYFSFLVFFLTIRTCFRLPQWSCLILFIFLFFNPLFIYASNHIMSDILFTGLSMLWFSQLIWIILNPKPYMLFTQALLLLIIFTIRYTALIYPIISVLVFIFNPQPRWQKLIGIALTALFLLAFIQFTRIKMEEIGGVRQFSSASGWKQASNALYMYEHIANEDHDIVPQKFQVLHQLTKTYFKNTHFHVDLYHIDQDFTTGSYYVAAYESPLMQYLRIKKGQNADVFDFKNIAPFGPYFNDYGNYLILHHPFAFVEHVVLPDFMAYLFPFAEIYGAPNDLYGLWSNYMGDMAKSWFGITNVTIPVNFIQIRAAILKPWPILFTIIHILFILSLFVLFTFNIYKSLSLPLQYCLLTLVLICILNFFFTILSAASVLRFQFSVVILEFVITIILSSKLTKTN